MGQRGNVVPTDSRGQAGNRPRSSEADGVKSRIVLAAVIAATVPAFSAAQSASPNTSDERPRIKTLTPDEVRGYLAGEGLGMAKAGELNHYPGPKHVLAMAGHLGLSDAQKTGIEKIEASMTAAAVPLGREIVDAEGALDRAFADKTIDESSLSALTLHIGDLEGQLRAVHLSAHLATRKLLTDDQVMMYDGMRGNGGSEMQMHDHGG
jgi:Spy/CpxP family protein refolding chaperone